MFQKQFLVYAEKFEIFFCVCLAFIEKSRANSSIYKIWSWIANNSIFYLFLIWSVRSHIFVLVFFSEQSTSSYYLGLLCFLILILCLFLKMEQETFQLVERSMQLLSCVATTGTFLRVIFEQVTNKFYK